MKKLLTTPPFAGYGVAGRTQETQRKAARRMDGSFVVSYLNKQMKHHVADTMLLRRHRVYIGVFLNSMKFSETGWKIMQINASNLFVSVSFALVVIER